MSKDWLPMKIASFLLQCQVLFARGMGKIKPVKGFLIGFCLLSGGLSIYYFIDALMAAPDNKITIEQINIPAHFNKTGEQLSPFPVDDSTYQRIQDYKKFMDSTQQIIRPGLLDSIHIIEQIYQQQKQQR